MRNGAVFVAAGLGVKAFAASSADWMTEAHRLLESKLDRRCRVAYVDHFSKLDHKRVDARAYPSYVPLVYSNTGTMTETPDSLPERDHIRSAIDYIAKRINESEDRISLPMEVPGHVGFHYVGEEPREYHTEVGRVICGSKINLRIMVLRNVKETFDQHISLDAHMTKDVFLAG